MKLTIVDAKNEKKGEVELPLQFSEAVRADLIARAVVSLQANKRQPYGAKSDAGLRASADVSKRRKNYRGSYGIGISRVPRKVMSRSGTRMNWVGAEAPGTVGGRRAHPPKAEKELGKKINEKERKKALRSAIAATVVKDVVGSRGHIVPEAYPFVVDKAVEGLAKTKDVVGMLTQFGFSDELGRASQKNVRAGKGKTRGRKYTRRVGPLFVVSGKSKLMDAAKKIPGVDVIDVKNLNAELLAPGAQAGRATLWSSAALEKMEKEKLFL